MSKLEKRRNRKEKIMEPLKKISGQSIDFSIFWRKNLDPCLYENCNVFPEDSGVRAIDDNFGPHLNMNVIRL